MNDLNMQDDDRAEQEHQVCEALINLYMTAEGVDRMNNVLLLASALGLSTLFKKEKHNAKHQ